jgi:hypothetical protein
MYLIGRVTKMLVTGPFETRQHRVDLDLAFHESLMGAFLMMGYSHRDLLVGTRMNASFFSEANLNDL